MIEKETALKFLAAGLAVLPADKTLKRPVMAWKNYQEHRPVTADVERQSLPLAGIAGQGRIRFPGSLG
jgi:hypothetical protein